MKSKIHKVRWNSGTTKLFSVQIFQYIQTEGLAIFSEIYLQNFESRNSSIFY